MPLGHVQSDIIEFVALSVDMPFGHTKQNLSPAPRYQPTPQGWHGWIVVASYAVYVPSGQGTHRPDSNVRPL